MHSGEPSFHGATNPDPPLAPAALDTWLRERLGRPMVVAVVAAGAQSEFAVARIEQGILCYGEVRLLRRTVTLDGDDAQLAALVAKLAPLDPDAVLVISTTAVDAARQWAVRALATFERGQGSATALSSRCSRPARESAPRHGHSVLRMASRWTCRWPHYSPCWRARPSPTTSCAGVAAARPAISDMVAGVDKPTRNPRRPSQRARVIWRGCEALALRPVRG
jgi:hypothetical protein